MAQIQGWVLVGSRNCLGGSNIAIGSLFPIKNQTLLFQVWLPSGRNKLARSKVCFQAWETIRSYSDEVYFHMLETHPPGVQFVSAPAETNNPCAPEVCLNAWKTNFTTQGLVSRVGKQTNAGCAELVSPGGKQTQATIMEFVSQAKKQTLFRKILFFCRGNKL